MPTTKHTATHDGQTFTRSSKTRVYTHVTLARRSYEHALAQVCSKGATDTHESNYRYYLRELDDTKHARPLWLSEAQFTGQRAKDKARATEALSGTSNFEEYLGKVRAERTAKIEADKAKGHYSDWINCGWSGSLTLAQKNAATLRNHPYYAEVVVVEAERTSKRSGSSKEA